MHPDLTTEDRAITRRALDKYAKDLEGEAKRLTALGHASMAGELAGEALHVTDSLIREFQEGNGQLDLTATDEQPALSLVTEEPPAAVEAGPEAAPEAMPEALPVDPPGSDEDPPSMCENCEQRHPEAKTDEKWGVVLCPDCKKELDDEEEREGQAATATTEALADQGGGDSEEAPSPWEGQSPTVLKDEDQPQAER